MKPIEKAHIMRDKLNELIARLSDEEALDNVILLLPWNGNGFDYSLDDRFEYGGNVYKVLQNHKSQPDWTPDTAHSLYQIIRTEDAEPKEWERPDGVTIPYYMIGDRCKWHGVIKESTIDYNHYSPEEYPQGWKDV